MRTLSLSLSLSHTHTHTPADAAASAYKLEQDLGWFADPLFFGDYPASVKAAHPAAPAFTEEQRALLKGSVDFLGINFYTAQ